MRPVRAAQGWPADWQAAFALSFALIAYNSSLVTFLVQLRPQLLNRIGFLVLVTQTYRSSSPARCRSPHLAVFRRGSFVAALMLVSVFAMSPVIGQPPGTLPPSSILNPANNPTRSPDDPVTNADTDAVATPPVVPKAFLMLDSAGNPVMVPGMTFEKLDRLMRLQDGLERPPLPFSFESMSISGRMVDTHAELNVAARILVEPTGGGWVAIPLRMGNFHRTGPADVSGVESYRMDLSDDGSGYLLYVQCDSQRTVVLGMRVVCKVAPAPSAAIEFRLPETVCDVKLAVPDAGVAASIVGRGDEVLRTQNVGQSTEINVESGGGTFSLRVGSQAPLLDNRPVLEAESRIVVDWQQADNAPLAAVDLTVRNLRGDLPKLTMMVPGSMRLLQQPEVRGGGPFEVLDPVDLVSESTPAAAGQRAGDATRSIDLVPFAPRSDSRVEVSLNGQMRSEGGRAGGMVVLSPIAMKDAVEQIGEIEVRTPRDFRLRWTPHEWVHSVWEQPDNESLTSRVYRFRFDRVPFELPIWLSARARQLRVESEWLMTLYDSLASLRMIIRATGSIPDTRLLPIDVGSWKVQSVFIADTTTPVEADRNGDTLEIDLGSLPSGGTEGDRIEVVLVQSLAAGDAKIDLPLPRLAGDQAAVGTLPSSLTVISQNDSRFVLDVASSSGIGEVIRGSAPVQGTSPTAPAASSESRYSLPDVSQAPRLVGFLVREKPSVSFVAAAEITVVADRINERVDWTIYPQGGLRGRLPIAWGEADEGLTGLGTDGPASLRGAYANVATNPMPDQNDENEVLRLSPLPPWSVVVDDSPATIQTDAQGRYQIYSDRLAGGPHRIQLRRSRELPALASSQSLLSGVLLPRPALADTTLRAPMSLRTLSSGEFELLVMGNDGRWTDELAMASLPQRELTLQLQPVEKQDDDFLVRRAVLRTAAGDASYYEQFLATIDGGGAVRIGLSQPLGEIRAKATVDGEPVEVARDADGRCLIRLGDKAIHRLDLQIWAPRSSRMLIDQVKPLMLLPIGIEQLYWQIIVPEDQHLIWATETMGRAMKWELDDWRLRRVPDQTDSMLVAWSGSASSAVMPPGHRYLFVGIDSRSLAATTMSRLAMWLVVGTVVLLTATLLTYVPRLRHPMTAITAAVGLGGLILLLPDAAVMTGQLVMVAMLIVSVMSGVRQLLSTRRGDRVLTSTRQISEQPSTRNLGPVREERGEPFIPLTEAVAPTGSVAESRS